MTDPELQSAKRCPFCGKSDLGFQRGTEDREGIPTNVMCWECGAAGPWVYARDMEDTQRAIRAWNRRVSHEP